MCNIAVHVYYKVQDYNLFPRRGSFKFFTTVNKKGLKVRQVLGTCKFVCQLRQVCKVKCKVSCCQMSNVYSDPSLATFVFMSRLITQSAPMCLTLEFKNQQQDYTSTK